MKFDVTDILTQLQTIEWSNLVAWLAIIIVAVPKVKKMVKDFELESGIQFPWTTAKEKLNKRFEDLDDKITKVDNRINSTRKEVEDKFNNLHEKEHQEHEVWHQQSITIRDNLKENQNKLEQNQNTFMQTLADISKSLAELKADFLDERLERKRYNILNCASKLRNGDIVDMEEFVNVFQDYDSYEDIIKKNGLTNGLIEESIKFIREKYQELLCKEK